MFVLRCYLANTLLSQFIQFVSFQNVCSELYSDDFLDLVSKVEYESINFVLMSSPGWLYPEVRRWCWARSSRRRGWTEAAAPSAGRPPSGRRRPSNTSGWPSRWQSCRPNRPEQFRRVLWSFMNIIWGPGGTVFCSRQIRQIRLKHFLTKIQRSTRFF